MSGHYAMNPPLPRISLIVPIYNREPYLEATLQSILHQTEANFELILWDDGSTDRSAAIAQDYANQDPRITLIQQPNQGPAQVLNAAIALGRAPYIGWVDSDDLLAPQALAVTAAILDQYASVGLVYGRYQEIDRQGNLHNIGSRCLIPYSKDRLLLDFMTFHFRLIRRSMFEQVGGLDASFEPAEDYDLCLRLSEVTDVYHVPEVLYFYRVHGGGVSQQKRLVQIDSATRAVEQALIRRGLDRDYELTVEITSRFHLVRKDDTELRL
jgi:glycosyltransferase involved in cell wall biosynthesis